MAADILAHMADTAVARNAARCMHSTGSLLQHLLCRQPAHALVQRGEQHVLARGQRRQIAHNLRQTFRTAQATAGASGQTAAALLKLGKRTASDLQMQRDACLGLFDLDVEHLAAFFHDAFAQAEAQGEIFEIGGRGQHHRVRDTVVFESDRHFLGHSIEVGGAIGSGNK